MDTHTRIGSYELLVPLARGGMGTVHVARRLGMAGFQRLVAIKRIHAHLAGEREFRAMLIDEARLSAAIHHPNVIPALDIVEDGDELALVLEYCEGVSLAQLAKAARSTVPLPPGIVARILLDMLAGLHSAHEAKDIHGRNLDIVHRDVSPQNVLVGSDGRARLIDFGVAKAAERISDTRTGVLKGKLRYMSPEQVRRKPLDRRSDVFASGAVLYEALCGRPPFLGDSEASILLALLGEVVPTPTDPNGETFGPALEGVLFRALASAPEDRFATAADLQKGLAQAITPASRQEVAEAVARHMGSWLAQLRHDLANAVAVPVPDVGERRDAPAKERDVRPATRAERTWRTGILAVIATIACAAALMLLERGRATGSAGAASAVAAPPPTPTVPKEEPVEPSAESSTTVTIAPRAPDAGRAPSRRRPSNAAPKSVLQTNPYP